MVDELAEDYVLTMSSLLIHEYKIMSLVNRSSFTSSSRAAGGRTSSLGLHLTVPEIHFPEKILNK